MKRYLFSGFLVILAVFMLLGCGKKECAKDILKKTEHTMKNYKSVLLDIHGHIESSPASGDSAKPAKIDIDCRIRTGIAAPAGWCLSLDGDGNIELGKTIHPFSFRKYMAAETDMIRTYTYEHKNYSWSYSDQGHDGKALAGIHVPVERAESCKFYKDTDPVSRNECYVLEYEISSSEAEQHVSILQKAIQELAGTKISEESGSTWALRGSYAPSIHAAWYINKENMLPCRYEAEFKGYPDSSLVIIFQEFTNRPVTVPKEIVLYAEKEYPFTAEPDSPGLDERDPLYEKADGERQEGAAQLPQSTLPDITEEAFEQALEELERRGWKLD